MRILIAAIAALTLVSPAEAFEGRYQVRGANPGGAQPYTGEALVRRNGAVYNVLWQTSVGRYLGTGVLAGSVLSVVYRDQAGAGPPGVAALAIVDNRIGPVLWSTFGANATGTEEWTMQAPQ